MEFINSLDSDYINSSMRLKSLDNDITIQAHNIIKTILILFVYNNDKKALYTLIEHTEQSDGEYMFIEIVESVNETINFNTIESLLSTKDLFSGLAHDIWDYMIEVDFHGKRTNL